MSSVLTFPELSGILQKLVYWMNLGGFLCPLVPFVGFQLVCCLLLFLADTVVVVQWIWFVVFDGEVCSRLTGFVVVLVVLVALVEMFW